MALPNHEHDYYAILEILPTATSATVTQSYRRLAKLTHPDRNLGDPEATAAFQRVSVRRILESM